MMKKAMILWFAITAGVGAFALLAQAGSTPAQAVEPDRELGGPGITAFVPGVSTFVTVEEVKVEDYYTFTVRGVLLGGSEVEERSYIPYYATRPVLVERCQKLMLLMLTKPGAYLLDMYQTEPDDFSCTLRRNE
ncbi:MAG TPA: hypothetical protein VNM90_26640 [Haliangium sp.]|nr:hypothetical protein [Haliangium sp.]